ncbi:Glycoside hydrolase [Tolypocladium paradoxum]|uniref:Glycoside hydrolase n=1 Tax=Tolypocladium paradoxum TaxID=94208 RepID=A0A2S4LAV1_9HYPO|nr:Glycoside hydrolase [Tolypocladium paradoxum]
MYNGIQDSQQSLEVNGVLDNFVNTFAPTPKTSIALSVILDIVSFGLTAVTGPFFNNFLRNTGWGKLNKDTGDNIKDTLRAVIVVTIDTLLLSTTPYHPDSQAGFPRRANHEAWGRSANLPSFLLHSKPNPASDTAMSSQLAVIVRHYKTALTAISTQAFSGSDQAISMLQTAISDGKLLDARPTGKLDLENRRLPPPPPHFPVPSQLFRSWADHGAI